MIGAATQSGVAKHGDGLSDQGLEPKIGGEAVERRRDHARLSQQRRQHPKDCSFAGAFGPNDQEDLLLRRVAGEQVAEDFLQRVDDDLVVGPKACEKREPVHRLKYAGVG